MDGIIKMLYGSLDYISHELIGNTIYITVASNKEELQCPICGNETNKVHSRYPKRFQDLPIQGKKVIVIMFCVNESCA